MDSAQRPLSVRAVDCDQDRHRIMDLDSLGLSWSPISGPKITIEYLQIKDAGRPHYRQIKTTSPSHDQKRWLVKQVLESPLGHKQLSRKLSQEMGRTLSREAVRRIRAGTLHADVLPEIERFEYRNKLCTACQFYDHKRKACDMGIPEADQNANLHGYNQSEVGLCYARRCSTFMPANP